jgi:hypothetical protein
MLAIIKNMSNKISIRQIANAFTPAKEISDSEKFAGRSEYVDDAWVESVALQASETGDLATFQINLKIKSPYIFIN